MTNSSRSVRIYIKPKTYEALRKRGRFGDTWDSIIQRLLGGNNKK